MGPYAFMRALTELTRVEPYNIIEVLSRMIYGSNMISVAGGSLPTTYRLCRVVFEETSQPPEEITQNDLEYEEIRNHLEFRCIPVSHGLILRCYRETLQHAQTAKYLIQKIFIDREAFSEATFKEAHRILTYKIDINQQTPWELYSGNYRTWSATYDTRFVDPVHITTAMLSMIDNLIVEMGSREVPYDGITIQQLSKEEVWERICYASKFCQRFINIRPFLDGNGRMYRLLLTTLLLRAGICPAVYGLHNMDRESHSRAEVSCYRHDLQGLGEVVTETHHELALFVLNHTYGQWRSTDAQMMTFLQATRRDGAMFPH
ncbi:hypothetical protein BFJ69_g11603 [Fusarium oxysporum]|uniref:Fido domain-containing protein n=1 Tax=Fusarium oxysporum TaxID=5507 RepID=A0A420MRT3_FUSOX|nr:hypothetical protein BFJ69_g11603 [Fusarium oxysporum]